MGDGASVKFSADDSGLNAALDRIAGKISGLVGKIGGLVVAWEATKKVAELVETGFDKVREALDAGGELLDLQNNTGIAVSDLAALQLEFKNAGKGAEDVQPAFAKMFKALETGSASKTVEALGLSMEELRKKAPVDQFHALGEAINKLPDPAERTAAAMDIFGKSGGTLLSVFASKGFGEAAGEIGDQAAILQKDAVLFDDVSDKLNLTGVKVQGFWVGVADKVAPVLKPLLDRFANLDLARYGQSGGAVIANIVQSLADGSVTEILATSAEIAFQRAISFLVGGLTGLGEGLWQVLSEVVKGNLTIFQVLTTPDFWVGMGQAVLGIAKSFVAIILDGVARLLHYASQLPGAGSLEDTAQTVRKTAAGLRSSGDQNTNSAFDAFSPVLDKAGADVQKSLTNIGDSIAKGWADGGAGDAFSSGALEKKLSDQWAKLTDRTAVASAKALAADPNLGPGGVTGESLANVQGSFTALQRVGGAIGGSGAGDPLLIESRRQSDRIAISNGHLSDIKALLKNTGTAPRSVLAILS